MKIEYSVHIAWSKDDEAYLACIPELPGCVADGETVEAALTNVKQIATEWLEVAKEEGRTIPRPMTIEDYEAAHREFQKNLDQQVKSTVMAAVAQLQEFMQAKQACTFTGTVSIQGFGGRDQHLAHRH